MKTDTLKNLEEVADRLQTLQAYIEEAMNQYMDELESAMDLVNKLNGELEK